MVRRARKGRWGFGSKAEEPSDEAARVVRPAAPPVRPSGVVLDGRRCSFWQP